MGPILLVLTQSKETLFDQILCFFYNENKILTILFKLIMIKSHFNDEFLVFLGPIISSFLQIQMR